MSLQCDALGIPLSLCSKGYRGVEKLVAYHYGSDFLAIISPGPQCLKSKVSD